MKAGLSTVNVNCVCVLNMFLMVMFVPGPFAFIVMGPCGAGAWQRPTRMHENVPPLSDETVRVAFADPIAVGSNTTGTATSTPAEADSAGGACTIDDGRPSVNGVC